MAGQITDLSALTGADLADDDLFEVVDISDTTMAASGTNKKITRAELAIGLGATRVYKTDLAYNTPNLGDLTYATCPIIYTPAVGDVLLDVVMRVTTATNNNIGLFVGTTNDLTNGVDATDQVINFRPLYADVTADLSYGNTNASANASFLPCSHRRHPSAFMAT
jgi:hypothetical protein